MKLNPGDGTGIIDDIDFICDTNSISYPTADKIRNINRHYYKAIIDRMRVEGRFQGDDPNLGSLPTDLITAVDDQHEYKLQGTNGSTADFLKLEAVEVKDIAGNWTRLQEIDISDLKSTITDYQNVSGVPRFYDVIGNYLYLYPAPDTAQVTATNGIKIWYVREPQEFASGDTSPEPGIAEPFHRLLSLGASYDWLVLNDTSNKADRVMQQYEQLRTEFREFYSNRNKDLDVRLQPAHNVRNYL